MEAVRHASNNKPIIDRDTPMTKDDVAQMVKMLRGLYPASPYVFDEQLVISTWRESAQLRQYETSELPAMYKRVMDRHKSFPALADVLEILRAIKKGPMQKPERVDMTNYVTTGYGPSMFAGYVEGHAEMNAVLTKLGHKPVQALRYEEFMKLHAPGEQ